MTSPKERPVVVYDGACGLCAGNLKWLYRLDHLKVFEAVPYQSEMLAARFPRLERERCEQALHLVFPDGRTYAGVDAFREVFLRMPLAFPLGIILWIPPVAWMLRKLYPILSRHRYRLGGTCEIPSSRVPNSRFPNPKPQTRRLGT